MESQARFCSNCGQPVTSGSLFCENCGQPLNASAPLPAAPEPPVIPPAPQPAGTTPPPQPARPAQRPPTPIAPPQKPLPAPKKKRNVLLFILLGLAILCLALVAIGVVVLLPRLSQMLPLAQPTLYPTAAQVAPTRLSPTSAPTSGQASSKTEYQDDFSNPSSGWPIVSDGSMDVTYAKTFMANQNAYFIGFKSPDASYIITPPHSLPRPLQNVSVDFRVTFYPVDSSTIEVDCRKTDDNNYYFVIVQNTRYRVGKFVKGNVTLLTDGWRTITPATTQKDAYFMVNVLCNAGQISLDVNGVNQFRVADKDLTSGEVNIASKASKDKADNGYYGYVLVKDFKLSILK